MGMQDVNDIAARKAAADQQAKTAVVHAFAAFLKAYHEAARSGVEISKEKAEGIAEGVVTAIEDLVEAKMGAA